MNKDFIFSQARAGVKPMLTLANISTCTNAKPIDSKDLLENIRKAAKLLENIPPAPDKMLCGWKVPKILSASIKPEIFPLDPLAPKKPLGCLANFRGIPIIEDESLPPNEYRIVDKLGNILHRGFVS